ncbi:hypothetical protein CS542_09845 [Pedobacter sp. IW39]|nr:hypothetical protein CS542_09845 [Pedobacter sp. IW39]
MAYHIMFAVVNNRCCFSSDIDIIRKLNVEPDLTVERSIQMGETVDIIDGPFEGFKGVVFERKGRKDLE